LKDDTIDFVLYTYTDYIQYYSQYIEGMPVMAEPEGDRIWQIRKCMN
jgi:hypothetical protein